MINAQSITNDAGYGIVNFVFMYFIGRYIRLYFNDKQSARVYGIGYVFCSLCLFGANIFLTKILGFYFNSFCSYDTIFCFVGSIMLFLCFKNIKLVSNKINWLSKNTLAVYIIHMHPLIVDFLFKDILKVPIFWGGYGLILVFYPLIIFLICIICEEIRLKTLGKVVDKILEK